MSDLVMARVIIVLALVFDFVNGFHDAANWGVGARLVWAWIFTIPASAAVAADSRAPSPPLCQVDPSLARPHH